MKGSPDLIVAPRSVDEIKSLADVGVDAFIVGSKRFSLVAVADFDEDTMQVAVGLVHELGKKVYLAIDAVFSNDLLVELEVYLHGIKHLPFDGIRVADLGAYMLLREIMPERRLHLVDAMMLTNYETVNFWGSKGVERVRLAHELTLGEVLEIKEKSNIEVELLVQGAPLMFTSRRKLIDNYLEFKRTIGIDLELGEDGNYLFDAERGLHYPIYENEHGTHIYGGKDVCMVDDLAQMLNANVDAFYLESLTYGVDEFKKVVQLYVMAIDLAKSDPEKYAKAAAALYGEILKLQPEFRQTDRGFYYKPTIYKNQQK